ncbi:hypothetical protein L204_103143 [Cryptococcus depauperatus]|nr:cytochrome P450 [Cryptococcus depauperatus CBS 7855]
MEDLKVEDVHVFSTWLRSLSPVTCTLYLAEVLVVLLLGFYIYNWPFAYYRLTFKNLPGPPSDSWLTGNLKYIIKSPPCVPHVEWCEEYGPTIRYQLLFGTHRFLTMDTVAMSFILSHGDIFPKPPRTRKNIADILGNGLIAAEGEDHKRQRKALNPSFSPATIRGMMPIFYDKSFQLRAKWLSIIEGDESEQPSPTPEKDIDKVQGGRKMDVMHFLAKTTLDIIGVAGFNYDFNALSEPHNELSGAYMNMMQAGMDVTLFVILQSIIPILQHIPTKRDRIIKESKKKTQEIGLRIINEKKRMVMETCLAGLDEKEDIGKDLLSILIKANMTPDLKSNQKLSDVEILDQITTFMLAGNETSSTALTWILYCLCIYPKSQGLLREECLSVQEDQPSLETLNALPYMDAVIREVLRLYSPVPGTMRETSRDVVVPLGTPVKGRDGTMIESVNLKKGIDIFIPVIGLNRLSMIWGPDAAEFKPERFLSFPSDNGSTRFEPMNVPGVWGNLLTFLGGTRNCIGYRLALAEIKVILFVLMRSFEFEELQSKPQIEKKTSIVMRPRVIGEESHGLQMPLMVKPLPI